MTVPQRIGLGIVGLLYGEFVAAPLFALAVLLRFPGNFLALVHHARFTLFYLLTIAAFEALICAITWFVFGSLLVALWPVASMMRNRILVYLSAIPLGLLAPALLSAGLWRAHRQTAGLPLMNKVLFLETFGFMLVASVVALHGYLKMARQAEEVLAAGGEFRY